MNCLFAEAGPIQLTGEGGEASNRAQATQIAIPDRSESGIEVEPAILERGHNRLRAVVDGQLAQDRGDVVLDRLCADA